MIIICYSTEGFMSDLKLFVESFVPIISFVTIIIFSAIFFFVCVRYWTFISHWLQFMAKRIMRL